MDFNAALDTISAVTAGVDVAADDPPYADFSLDEHGLRYARVLALMAEEDLDVLVLTSEESIRYVSGYNSMIWAAAARWLPGALVVTRDPGRCAPRGLGVRRRRSARARRGRPSTRTATRASCPGSSPDTCGPRRAPTRASGSRRRSGRR